MNDHIISTIKKTNRRGSQGNKDGKAWEHFISNHYQYKTVQELTDIEYCLLKPLFQDYHLELSSIKTIHMEVIPGTGKSDILIEISFNEASKPSLFIPIQLKSLPSRTQFSIGNAKNFTDVFVDKYPLAAIGFQKIVGYGEYAKLAEQLGAGGEFPWRFLCDELTLEERLSIKNMLEDPVTLKSVLNFIFLGTGNIQPEYCFFSKKNNSTDIKNVVVMKYNDIIKMMISQSLNNCLINLEPQNIPFQKINKNSKAGISSTYFNFKMYYASKNIGTGHMLQIMATPNIIYKRLQEFMK